MDKRILKLLISIISISFLSISLSSCSSQTREKSTDLNNILQKNSNLPIYTYRIINTFNHDPTAYTQGLVAHDGYIYESTGKYGQSSIRKIELNSGKIIQKYNLADNYFGEGITIFQDKIIQLTWKSKTCFVYNLDDFKLIKKFSITTEGWGITHDGERIIYSNGSSTLFFLSPDTYELIGQIKVTAESKPVSNLNELEYVEGEIFANIWQTNTIARIKPESGQIKGWVELDGLLEQKDLPDKVDVLNGIAYDSNNNRLFVTGKLWPKLFEIELNPK